MDPLLIAIIVSLVILGGIYYYTSNMSKSTVKNMDLRGKELAVALGLPVTDMPKNQLSSFHTIELNGIVKDREFYFTSFTRSEKTSSSFTTQFSWKIKGSENNRVIISKEGIVTTFQKQFGVKDTQIGEKDFDDLFLVKCDDPTYAKRVLNSEFIRYFIKHAKILYGTIIIHHQEVHYEESGVLSNEQDLQRLLRLIELCRLIAIETEKNV
jgi:hypothetical protein